MDSRIATKQLMAIKRLTPMVDMRLAAEWPKRWKILIATILSAVTRDEVTIPICKKLFKKYPSLEALGKAEISLVEKIIRPVNFYKNKSRNIIATARALTRKRIPNTVDELIKLPGVGRKVANVYLVQAHGADAIGVDTHVARISFKLGWTKSKNPEKVEKDLEKLFPRKYWGEINEILVRFGKIVGTSRRREDAVLETLIKNT